MKWLTKEEVIKEYIEFDKDAEELAIRALKLKDKEGKFLAGNGITEKILSAALLARDLRKEYVDGKESK